MALPAAVDPKSLFPFGAGAKHTVFLKPLLDEIQPPRPHLSAGEYSYYSDFEDPTRFFIRNVRYDFGFSGARLDIGKYCAFAHDTTFILSDANHATEGPSTYPFPVFGGAWAEKMAPRDYPAKKKGSTRVGHDVWCGYKCVVMPGVTIGTGAIIAACSVVTRDVPPYAMVAGNPARVVKMRFEPHDISKLLEIAWWDWPAERVAAAVPHLVAGDASALAEFAR